ncbi:hypothetical protein K488DRAFT_91087 [Vararia minispora EC-137]|uniref:Uncharacterized protein n=1 Tax=Vararia minispora EC-137 TaxID=1314806 RepID=A0ACB8Q6L8_9AGAM|nr:hypothetical protein K488DRAFT_91087 [Vararia minispora EC-137]
MALDESDLRDCFKHVLTLCHAWDSREWARRFREQIETWVRDYAFNAHVVLMWEAEPERTRGRRFSAGEGYARFYACRRAMAGLTQECDLIVREGAHAWRVATSGGHTVLDGRDVDADAFRRTFGWWSAAERLHFRSSQETLPFRISEGIRERARQLGLEEPPRDRITQILQWMYPRPATAEDSIRPVHCGDNWEFVWGAHDFEREYAVSEDSSDNLKYRLSHLMRRSRLIPRRERGGRPGAGGEEEQDFVLDIRRVTIAEGGQDVEQELVPVGVRARTDLHVRPLPRPPSRPRGMRPMPARAHPRPPVAPAALRIELGTLPEHAEGADGRDGLEEDERVVRRDGRAELERGDGRDGRELLSVLGEFAGVVPSPPLQDRLLLPDASSSFGHRSMHREVERHSVDPSALYLVFEHGELARATGEGASLF